MISDPTCSLGLCPQNKMIPPNTSYKSDNFMEFLKLTSSGWAAGLRAAAGPLLSNLSAGRERGRGLPGQRAAGLGESMLLRHRTGTNRSSPTHTAVLGLLLIISGGLGDFRIERVTHQCRASAVGMCLYMPQLLPGCRVLLVTALQPLWGLTRACWSGSRRRKEYSWGHG